MFNIVLYIVLVKKKTKIRDSFLGTLYSSVRLKVKIH